MEDLSGRSFGVYRILEPLGAGGMASVYKAYQPAVDRYVALKVLPSHLAQDPEFLARFEQEAKVLAKLQHPHILPVHDFGESGGFTYIVMPFIKTGTLAATLTGQPLPFDQIKRVITQVGDALDCAHSQGLVHRDVKPSNILLDARGNCLLADFGIAKILEGADTLTATGNLIGTPKYMSPEQGLGKPIDGRSDIYSLGVVLFEMATGQVPFEAETPLAVVVKHIRDPLPVPSRVNPAIPESLQRMILRAMHKEPSERFATAGVMVDTMSTMTEQSVPLSVDQDATIPIGGVPPRPIVAPDSPPGANDVTVPTAVNAQADARPSPGLDDAAVTATGDTRSDQRQEATATTARGRRLVAIGVVALVVLALLLVFRPWDDAETELTQALNHTVPQIADAPSAPAPETTSPTEQAVAEPAETTPPATTDQPTPAPTDAGSAPERAPAATVATGELLISVDAPSLVTLHGEAVGRFEPGVPRTITAPVGQHVVVATADDGVTLDQAPVELGDGAPQVVVLELAAEVTRRAAAAARDPFPDQGDGTFLDRQTGFLWTVASSARQGLWSDADAHCEDL